MMHRLMWLGIMLGVLAATAQAAPAKTNVLFIAVDDLRPELGCYGAEGVKTPNIDRLAESGMLFERHYVQFAVCIPSRVSLLTSLRPERTNQVYGPPVWEKVEGAQPIGKTFHAAGYNTVSLGKIWHVEGGNLSDEFDVKWTPSGGEYASAEAERIKDARQKLRNQAKREGKPFKEDPKLLPPIAERADAPESAYKDGMTGDKALEEMQRLAADEKPFLLMVGFSKPHLPFVAPEKYWALYNEDDMPLAKNLDFPEYMPEVAFSRHPNMFSYSYGEYEPFVMGEQMPDKTARHLIHAYRAATSFIDAQAGRLLAELERLGLAENTVVVLWGDHGWQLGDSGFWSKHTNFEAAARSPLIVRAPGLTQPGTRCARLVETVDILPTLLDLCGIAPLPVSDGKSFVPLLDQPDLAWKGAVYHVFNRNRGGLVIGHAVRTGRYRLVSWQRGWGMAGEQMAVELYDYVKDPYETKNAANDPEYQEARKKLEQLLRDGPPGELSGR